MPPRFSTRRNRMWSLRPGSARPAHRVPCWNTALPNQPPAPGPQALRVVSGLGQGLLYGVWLGTQRRRLPRVCRRKRLPAATLERIHKHAPIIRIGEGHGANAEVRQKVKVTLEACHAAAVTDNRNSVFAVYDQAHPISLVLAVGNL